MTDWIKVVTHPSGLAGVALFLVFGRLAKVKSKDQRRWLSQAAVAPPVVADQSSGETKPKRSAAKKSEQTGE